MTGFQTFKDYIYLKRHFNDYLFIWEENREYNRIKVNSFIKRKDRQFFSKVEEFYNDRRKVVDHLISCFIFNQSFWIGDTFNEDNVEFHKERMKKIGSLESHFQNELEKIEFLLFDKNLNFQQIILTNGLKTPIIIEGEFGHLSLETLTIIDHFTDFAQTWLPLNPLLKIKRFMITKYKRLLRLSEYDYQKIEKTFNLLYQYNSSTTLAPSA